MRLLFVIGCFLFLIPHSFSQIQVLPDKKIIEKKRDDIKIKVVNNNVLMPVDLGRGLVLYFILDSGVKTTIITDPILINLLDIPIEREMNVKGYGTDEPIPAWVSTKFNYRLNETYTFENQDVIILQEAINLDQYLGEPVYGIIGYDFLKDHQITINFLQEKMSIKAPKNERKIERLKRKKNVKVFDLDFEGSKPFIHAPLQNGAQKDTLKLLVDTGFSGAISLYPNETTNAFLNDPIIPNYQGYGMNGLILSQFKKLESFTISNTSQLKQVSTHFIDSLSLINVSHTQFSDGSIGNDILRRFIVSLDYKNKKMYLRPLKSKIKEPFNYNRAGIRVLYQDTFELGKHYIVQSVRKGANADLSGLQKGDIILTINEKPTRRMSISKVYSLLNTDDDQKKKLEIKRNDEILNINFDLEQKIEWN